MILGLLQRDEWECLEMSVLIKGGKNWTINRWKS